MLNLKSKVQYKVNTEQCILHSDKLIIPTIFLHYLTISQLSFLKNSQICTNCYKIPSKQKIYINDGYTYMHKVDYTILHVHPCALKNSTFYLQVTHHEFKNNLHYYVL